MNNEQNSETRNTLLVAGGAALMIVGAGLMMAHPGIRRQVLGLVTSLLPDLQGPLKNGTGRVLEDVERYLKIREM